MFNQGDEFLFEPITLIVGDQGCGKSTLLKTFSMKPTPVKVTTTNGEKIQTLSFDFEKDNPRQTGKFESAINKVGAGAAISLLHSSHGQAVKALLRTLNENPGVTFFIDEPDMALSIRSCYELVEMVKSSSASGCQIIMAVHNPIIISSFQSVLSIEHRRWMTSKEFIASHSPKGN